MQLLSKSLIDQKQQVGHKANLSGDELFFIELKRHDCAAFKKLYKRYSAAVYGNIRRNINDEEKAKLILAQTFCDVWQSFSLYDETKFRIFTWINQFALQNVKKSSS